LDRSCVSVETAWTKRRSSKAHYYEREKRKTQDVLEREHNIMDRAQARSTDAASGGASRVETDCPQCSQPSDRGWLKTRYVTPSNLSKQQVLLVSHSSDLKHKAGRFLQQILTTHILSCLFLSNPSVSKFLPALI